MSREVEEALLRWRSASRAWEAGSRGPEAARMLAKSWLDYQLASGGVEDDEIVLVADDSGCYVAATANVERYLGIDAESLLGMSIADLTPPRDRPRVAAAWAAFVANETADGDYDLWRADGQEV